MARPPVGNNTSGYTFPFVNLEVSWCALKITIFSLFLENKTICTPFVTKIVH